jgi:hypothetical protein
MQDFKDKLKGQKRLPRTKISTKDFKDKMDKDKRDFMNNESNQRSFKNKL